MTPAEFKHRYQQAEPPELRAMYDDPDMEMGDGFVTLPARRGKNLQLTAEERELLTSAGLPENAPMMSFDLNDPQPLDEFPHCIQIGSTAFGDPVCFDSKTREVVYFNHDRNRERVLVNSSLSNLAECLAIFMEHSSLKLPAEELNLKRLNALIQADPALASQDSIWQNG